MNEITRPLVSIIIPYYNCKEYITETLQSIELQTYLNIETIIINDGSDRQHTAFLEALVQTKKAQQKNIHYVYQTNKGVSSARNTGGRLACGDYILFLDADDKLHPEFIQKTLASFIHTPNCVLAYSKSEYFDAMTGECNLPLLTGLKSLLMGNRIPVNSLHKMSDFIRLHGFDESLRTHGDWDYWIRLLKDGGAVNQLNEVLFYRRKRPDGSSLTDGLSKNTDANQRSWQAVYDKHKELFLQHNLGYADLVSAVENADSWHKKYNEMSTTQINALNHQIHALGQQNALVEQISHLHAKVAESEHLIRAEQIEHKKQLEENRAQQAEIKSLRETLQAWQDKYQESTIASNEALNKHNQMLHQQLSLYNKNSSLQKELVAIAHETLAVRAENERLAQQKNAIEHTLAHINNLHQSMVFDLEQQQHSHKKYKELFLLQLLKPFIKLELGIHSLNRYRKAFRILMHEKGSFGKAYQFIRQYYQANGLKATKAFLKNQPTKKQLAFANPTINESNIVIDNTLGQLNNEFNLNGKIIILCTKHTHYVAKLVQDSLNQLNTSSEIIFDEPNEGFSDLWHIVICPQMYPKLPKNYLAFQMEQSVSSRWFNTEYFNKLEKAKFVFDYSITNLNFLQKNNIPFSKLFYLPIGMLESLQKNNTDADNNFEYEVAFYGDPNCERRKNFLEELQKNFKIKVISEVFGDELYNELKKAKIIVNIHYYENALLETTRIYECLSLNKLIVSETGSDQPEHKQLTNLVDFVEINDVSAMIQRISYWLQSPNEYAAQIQKIENEHLLTKQFQFYFYRFLLSQDLINFDDFYRLASDYVQPKSNFWCLSLPESTDRRSDFQKDNIYGIEMFTGLRHHIGWIGCGLSYKFMMKTAEKLQLANVTICEDDVLFYENFGLRYQNIQKILSETDSSWDIFSGLIADLKEEIDISPSDIQSEKENFYRIDKLVSMVFNVYNQSSYEKIYHWDSNNRSTNNTIDRYIENHGGIRGLIVSPFLVGHKEDLHSTLWGASNSIYVDMIAKSQKILEDKISKLTADNKHE